LSSWLNQQTPKSKLKEKWSSIKECVASQNTTIPTNYETLKQEEADDEFVQPCPEWREALNFNIKTPLADLTVQKFPLPEHLKAKPLNALHYIHQLDSKTIFNTAQILKPLLMCCTTHVA